MSKLNKKLVKSIAKELEKCGLLSDDLSSVAGGSPGPNTTLIPFDDLFSGNPAFFDVKFRLPSSVPGSTGSVSYTDVIEPGPHELSFPKKLGARHRAKLVRGLDGKTYVIQ